jgi:hypothetical protein
MSILSLLETKLLKSETEEDNQGYTHAEKENLDPENLRSILYHAIAAAEETDASIRLIQKRLTPGSGKTVSGFPMILSIQANNQI